MDLSKVSVVGVDNSAEAFVLVRPVLGYQHLKCHALNARLGLPDCVCVCGVTELRLVGIVIIPAIYILWYVLWLVVGTLKKFGSCVVGNFSSCFEI